MKNVISLGKLLGLLLLFHLPLRFKLIGLLLFCRFLKLLLSINVHTKNTKNKLARLVMGTISLETTKKMVTITRRVNSCLALSILLSILANLSSSLSCVFSASQVFILTPHLTNALSVSHGLLF